MAMEAAIDQAKTIQSYQHGQSSHPPSSPTADTHKLTDRRGNNSSSRKECFRCCAGQHHEASCPFKNKECFYCKHVGHTASVCRKKARAANRTKGQGLSTNKLDTATENANNGSNPTHFCQHNPVNTEDEMFDIYAFGLRKENRVLVTIDLNDQPIVMEVDTGASLTVLSEETLAHIFHTPKIVPTDLSLRTFTGEIIKPVGKVDFKVNYEGLTHQLTAVITPNDGPTLLGRDWLKHLRLNWAEIFHVSTSNQELDKLLPQYSSIFEPGLGTMKDVTVNIKVKPQSKPYSEWASPIVPVVKPDGTIRICGDYKAVNKVTLTESYPLPKTEDLFSTLSGGEKFSKLDLSHAYQQIQLDEESKDILTINTHRGLFRPTRLQFGVHLASGVFQREMEKRLSNIPLTFVRVDDILVSGENDHEHLRNLSTVLDIIKQCGLKLKRSKCILMAPEVTYLSYRINKNGVSPLPEKINAILKAPTPTNTTQVKSFLGMLNYYHRHLPNLAHLLEPLHLLLRKNTQWTWGTEQDKAFKNAKGTLCSASLLVHFDPLKPITLSCDASPYGLGAVLSHLMEDGTERPIAFASRTLANAERNFSQIEKEGLAIIYAVRKFHQYLYGTTFTLVTDHKPLLGLLSDNAAIPTIATARIQRWAIILSGYNYTLRYRPGYQNSNADCMSRLPIEDPDDVSKENYICMTSLARAPVTADEVKTQTRRDPVLSRVLELIRNGWEEGEYDTEAMKAYFQRRTEISIQDDCLLWGYRVIIHASLRKQCLDELLEAHPGICRMKALARSHIWWPNMDAAIEETTKACESCRMHQNQPARAPIHPWEVTQNRGHEYTSTMPARSLVVCS